MTALNQWRQRIRLSDFKNSLFGPSSILDDETLIKLASVGPVPSLIELEAVVGAGWIWLGKCGDSLLAEMHKMNIPPMKPKPAKPRKARTQKRALEQEDHGGETNKRAREDHPPTMAGASRAVAAPAPTPATGRSVPVPMAALPATPSRLPASLIHNPYAVLHTPYYHYPSTPSTNPHYTPHYHQQWNQYPYYSPLPPYHQPMFPAVPTHPAPSSSSPPVPRNPDSAPSTHPN